MFGAWVHSSCDSRTVEPRPFSRQPAQWNFRPFDRFRNQLLEPFSQPVPFGMVGSNGLGPSTSRLSGVCSNQLSYEPMCGGGNRIRTDDPLLAGQVLYQLSYTPILFANLSLCENKCSPFKEACFLLKMNKKEIFISDRLRNGQIAQLAIRLFSLKGGDPAAPSDTATLLRLHPSHRYCLRQLPPCG